MPRGREAAWTRHWRLVATLAVIGAFAGAFFAAAGPPRYASDSSVIVTRDSIASDPVEMRRLAELSGGSQVAEEAASLLGGDLAGADLLGEVTILAAAEGGALKVTSTADSPDVAIAVADAYAAATSTVLGGPLELGSAATSTSEVGGRAVVLWSAIGLLFGVLLGLAVAFALGRGVIRFESAKLRRRATATEEQPSAASTPAEVLPGAAEIIDFDSAGAARLSFAAKGVVTDLLESASPWNGERRSLAVLAAEDEDASGAAAAALAVAAAGRGRHVLLVDGRLGHPSVAGLLGVEAEPGLAEYLGGVAGPRKVLRRVPVVGQGTQGNQLACLPAGEGEPGAGIVGERFTELVERVVRVYDLVVIAGPSLLSRESDSSAIARLADGVVVVCGLEPEHRTQAKAAVEGLRGANLHQVVGMERP